MKLLDFWFAMEIFFGILAFYSWYINNMIVMIFSAIFVYLFLGLLLLENKKRKNIARQMKNASRMARE
jgi:uncharacterized membrane protein